MLVVAAAAVAEMGTARGNPLRGWGEHFDQAGAGVALFFIENPHTHLFTGQDVRHKHCPPVWQAPEAISAVYQAEDLNVVKLWLI